MMSDEALTIRQFEEAHFPEYRAWFEDSELRRQLGTVDDEWLDCVLAEGPGRQFAVFCAESLVAVLGLYFEGHDPRVYITDLAVRPELRRQGIAAALLGQLARLALPVEQATWHAFVDAKNPAAQALFESAGWQMCAGGPDSDGMFEYRREDPA